MPVHEGHFGDERAGPRAAGQRLAVRALGGQVEEHILDGQPEVYHHPRARLLYSSRDSSVLHLDRVLNQ